MLITFLKYTTLALRQEMQPSHLQLSLAYAAASTEETKFSLIRRQETKFSSYCVLVFFFFRKEREINQTDHKVIV